MAHLWIKEPSGWEAHRLSAALFPLAPAGSGAEPSCAGQCEAAAALLVRSGAGAAQAWALIAAPSSVIRVNGEAPLAGLRALSDRDEIRADDRRYIFSTETLAQVVPFPGAERAVSCGRCRQQLVPGAPAVECPRCGVWYDQAPELPCWTYAAACAFCAQATALDTGFQWTPEDEGR